MIFKKTLILFAVIILWLPTNTFAHKRAKYNIVIDTDAGVDDYRAITLFCASREFNINCITTVDGVLNPKKGANYLSELLKIYHHEGIPIGMGKEFNADKNFENHAETFWQNLFNEQPNFDFPDATKLMGESVKNEKGRTVIIALGPLTNIYQMLKKYPENCAKTEMILWYCEFDSGPKGYNYQQNIIAYDEIQKLRIPIKLISDENIKYSNDFYESCKIINSVYANSWIVFNGIENQKSTDMYLWDDLVPLYLLYPTFFAETFAGEYLKTVKLLQEAQPDILISAILNSDKPESGVVFNEIPQEGFMVMNDVGKFCTEIIERHGYNEYKIASLTSEIHSHMGIYSILGAKTGLRIMEYLHAGLDEIEIISYAGYNPPISCFNDGLQVGTGSTIGYGTISVDTTQSISPSVMVKYNGRKILFAIKPEIVAMARKDVGELIRSHGLESEMYWIKLRELSIEKYWLGVSRFDMLNIEEIK